MSRFDDFKAEFAKDPDAFREKLRGNGTFEYSNQVKELEQLSRKMGSQLLVYLFDEQLGNHLAMKFVEQCGRNLLFFLPMLTAEYRMFILHELKTNPHLKLYG